MGKIIVYSRLAICLVLLWAAQAAAQSSGFPYKIPEGTSQTITAEGQALWVLKESQFDRAVADSKRLRIVEQTNTALRKQRDTLKTLAGEQRTLIDTLKADRDFYKENWEIAEQDIQVLAKQRDTEARWKKIFRMTAIIGIPVAFVAGLIIL